MIIANIIKVYDKNCIGCYVNNREIMISISNQEGKNLEDIFLTKAQAKILVEELAFALKKRVS